MKNFNILYVDDEESNLKGFKSIYFTEYKIFTAISGMEALSILESNEIHIIITDQKMPEMTGVEFLSNAISKYPDPIRIILTGYSDIEVLMQAINECGIFRYLTKPWDELEMNMTINQAIETYNLRKENKELINELKDHNIILEGKVKERTKEVEDQKEEILIQNKELTILNNKKNDLIQTVAHDLRSPLNQIKGMGSVMKLDSQKLSTEHKSFIDIIIQSTERLRNMIDKILDLHAIDSDTVNVKIERVEISKIINDIANQCRILANEKELKINVHHDNGELFALVDVNYFIQVLENLLSNAIKFSPPNKNIFIETENHNSSVRIKIIDEGQGLSDSDMKHIFQKYKRLSAKPTGGEASTGLGLSIVKKYVETMNGKIYCENNKGDGATFIVEFDKS